MSELKMPKSMTITGKTVADFNADGQLIGVKGIRPSRFVVRCHPFDPIYIRPANHLILCRLAFHRMFKSPFIEPVDGGSETKANGVKYVSLLRSEFREVGIDGMRLIVSDYQGRYALAMGADDVMVDWSQLILSADTRIAALGRAGAATEEGAT